MGRLDIYVFYVDFLKAFDNCVHSKWEMGKKRISYEGKFLTLI